MIDSSFGVGGLSAWDIFTRAYITSSLGPVRRWVKNGLGLGLDLNLVTKLYMFMFMR